MPYNIQNLTRTFLRLGSQTFSSFGSEKNPAWLGSDIFRLGFCGSGFGYRAGRTQSSSWRHVCDASEAGLELEI